jgi:hypothetical protein
MHVVDLMPLALLTYLMTLTHVARLQQRQQPEGSPELVWFEDDGRVKGDAAGKFIRDTADGALRQSLARLRDVLSIDTTKRAQVRASPRADSRHR